MLGHYGGLRHQSDILSKLRNIGGVMDYLIAGLLAVIALYLHNIDRHLALFLKTHAEQAKSTFEIQESTASILDRLRNSN